MWRHFLPAIPAFSTVFLVIAFLPVASSVNAQGYTHPWMAKGWNTENILNRIPVPAGYERTTTKYGTFQDWLRHLPLKKGKPLVHLFNGQLKNNQTAHFAVLDIDVGIKDLQQCADAVIRLRAEYLYSMGEYDAIHFKFTSGDNAKFREWIKGYRPDIGTSQVHWKCCEKIDSSYANFRDYLDKVFNYAGTFSLSQELSPIADIDKMQIGNVFIRGGFPGSGSPGHAVIVVDMAVNINDGAGIFLLAQSYMPAQEIHILKNPTDSSLSPWYKVDFGDTLYTPEWIFHKNELNGF